MVGLGVVGQGDDWDAVCVRCGWCCEADGYDDDSAPLPEFKAAYDRFRRLLLQGTTASYSPPSSF